MSNAKSNQVGSGPTSLPGPQEGERHARNVPAWPCSGPTVTSWRR